MSMPRLDWSNIDKAIARGDVIDPRVWDYIDRVIGVKRAIPDTRLSSTAALETPLMDGQRDIADVAIVVLADGGDIGAAINGLDAPENDKMEWLADHARNIKPLIDPQPVSVAPSALEKRLSRLGVKAVEGSPHGNGAGSVNLDGLRWIEGEYALYQSLPSAQRRTVWMALKGMNVTGDQPSCGDLELLTGVSHTTCAKVLPLYRETHGL
jgi:hypothetical protein